MWMVIFSLLTSTLSINVLNIILINSSSVWSYEFFICSIHSTIKPSISSSVICSSFVLPYISFNFLSIISAISSLFNNPKTSSISSSGSCFSSLDASTFAKASSIASSISSCVAFSSSCGIISIISSLYTSGTVFHAFLGEKLPDWKAAANLVRKIAENYKLPYYTMSPTYSICKDHGYLTGEQYTCPHCGGATEVYSRITGYYRPVQNWNDGKSQEYKERKVYDIANSKLTRCECEETEDVVAANVAEAPVAAAPANKTMLFTTKTCPNCRIVAMHLDEANIAYEKVDAEEVPDLVAKYGIRQAPTLVVVKDGKAETYANASNIIGYIAEN